MSPKSIAAPASASGHFARKTVQFQDRIILRPLRDWTLGPSGGNWTRTCSQNQFRIAAVSEPKYHETVSPVDRPSMSLAPDEAKTTPAGTGKAAPLPDWVWHALAVVALLALNYVL